MGVICVSSAEDGEPLALVDVRSVTALRTGAVAAVAAQELAREDASTVGIVGLRPARRLGGALPGRRRVRPGRLLRPRPRGGRGAGRRAGLGGRQPRGRARRATSSTCVTPGAEPVVRAADLRPGAHLNMLGADGPGKAEADVEAVERCELFCDEWHQASHGGELTGRGRGRAGRARPRDRAGRGAHRRRAGARRREATTLFDSTGLAIQDLALCLAVLEAHRAGVISAGTAKL